MKAWLAKLWNDEARFRAFLRGGIAMGGALAPLIPGVPEWVAPVVVAAATFISAGERNERT